MAKPKRKLHVLEEESVKTSNVDMRIYNQLLTTL